MGSNIWDIRNQNRGKEVGKKPGRQDEWPQIGSYIENGITVRVMKPAWCEGGESNHEVKATKKRKPPK